MRHNWNLPLASRRSFRYRPFLVFAEKRPSSMGLSTAGYERATYRRGPSLLTLGVMGLAFIFILSLWPVANISFDLAPSPPSSALGAIWQWLRYNKDSIAPLSQIASAVGVVVAAITFFRSQKLNRANWFLQIYKDAYSLAEKMEAAGYSNKNMVKIISFYAAVFPYHNFRLIGDNEWSVLEKDLRILLTASAFLVWLRPGASPPPDFPSTSQFDPTFISYLRELQRNS